MEDFHATLLHEAAGHGSQAVKRLAMMSSDLPRFGSAEYARLELIAELASAQLGAQLGLPIGPSLIASHAAYLASWLRVLKGDKNEIFKAAANAQKICDYVLKLAVETSPQEVQTAKDNVKSELMQLAEIAPLTNTSLRTAVQIRN